MADRFDEMARAWLGLPPDRMGLDDELPTLSALLRKVHDEARLLGSAEGSDEMIDFLQSEYVLTGDALSHDAQHLARKVSKYNAEMCELLAARKVVEAARRRVALLRAFHSQCAHNDCAACADEASMRAVLDEYDKAVRP